MEPLKEYSRIVLSLENTIFPDERLRETSSLKDRVSHKLEVNLCIVGCEYIQSAGILLKLPQVAYSIYPMAMACIFLAAKTRPS